MFLFDKDAQQNRDVHQPACYHQTENKQQQKGEGVAGLIVDWVEVSRGAFLTGLRDDQINKLETRLRTTVAEDAFTACHDTMLSEKGQRSVLIDTFYISRYPITNAQFLRYAESNHHFATRHIFKGNLAATAMDGLRYLAERYPDHPVDLSWHAAMAMCDWMGARLPTSHEWEKAARGTDGRLYPWGDDWNNAHGNFAGEESTSVQEYPLSASPYGLEDVMGNCYEWTLSTQLSEDLRGQYVESVVCRSSDYRFDRADTQRNPVWFRHRVTNHKLEPTHVGTNSIIGLRPLRSRWQRQAWSGFR